MMKNRPPFAATAAMVWLFWSCMIVWSNNPALGFTSSLSSSSSRSLSASTTRTIRHDSSVSPLSTARTTHRRVRQLEESFRLWNADADEDGTTNRAGSNNTTTIRTAIASEANTPGAAQLQENASPPLSAGAAAATTIAMSNSTIPPSTIPSYRTLMVFTLTTILIWISEPLLSLVDTTIVGMTATASKGASTVVQIAALGPATTLYDSAIYATYFLAIATTNLISPAMAARDWKALRKATSHLALVFGSMVTLICFTMGRQFISNMVLGGGGAVVGRDPQALLIVPLATSYAWIRAVVAPFSVVDFVAQSFCLATLDTKTPAMAVALASVVNIVGDLLLAPRWGIQGAAVATAMATISSCLVLVRRVWKRTREWKGYQEQEENMKKSLTTQVVNGSIEINTDSKTQQQVGAHSNSVNITAPTSATNKTKALTQDVDDDTDEVIPFFSIPNRKSLVELFKLAGPIFCVMMAKIACYSILTVRATHFGILPLATHNIMMRVFFFFACFGDSLSQATQTFVPQITPGKERRQLFQRLALVSAGVGLFISNASKWILSSKWSSWLTKDVVILEQMRLYAPYVGAAIFLHPFIMLLEGSILAKRDLGYLVGMYVLTTILHMGLVFYSTGSFEALWQVFLIFQSLRLVQFAGRMIFQTTRTTATKGRFRLLPALRKWRIKGRRHDDDENQLAAPTAEQSL